MTTEQVRINLLLLDDHAMFREGLARTLEREADLRVVAQCGSSGEALQCLTNIDVVLLDVDLNHERGLAFVEEAKKISFAGRILVVTAGIGGHEAVRLIQAGVNGILDKRNSGRTLCESIRRVVAGEPCIDEKYITSLVRSLDRTRNTNYPKLTERDRALLRYVLEGLTNREIGVELNISEGAVKASLHHLFEKLNVRTRSQLVKIALEQYQDQL
ncbi:MAG TPA: response regulator transcription factor [Bryobacteraceae bacterium]|jgi:two-component system nitrate/nitrite response regulator NarL|nr:response regulator transcription factor [Bryobacteraceae bacterium]